MAPQPFSCDTGNEISCKKLRCNVFSEAAVCTFVARFLVSSVTSKFATWAEFVMIKRGESFLQETYPIQQRLIHVITINEMQNTFILPKSI